MRIRLAPGPVLEGCAAALILALSGVWPVAAQPPGSVADRDPASWVDPFIGTGGHGHTYPGATLPFGMVQLSPDTRLEGWDGCSGYHYDDQVIYGFSHTHLSGTGVADYCDVLFMPMSGAAKLHNGYRSSPDEGYASRFRKESEQAEPGWYGVHLEDYGIDVELTATQRTGLHRYRFLRGEEAHVIVDLAHRDPVLDSQVRIVSDREIEGWRRSSSWARDQWVYFVARFSRPFERAKLAVDDRILDGRHQAKGTNVKAVLSFGERTGELLIKVGISAVDLRGARMNLEQEQPRWDFEGVRGAARRQWNAALERIQIEGASDEQRTIFTTALYHSLLAPNLYSDVDHRYRGMDQRIHHATGWRQHTVFSLWDTFRATHPLFTLLEIDRSREFIRTFLTHYEQGGRLPVWELAANETDCMIGYHSVSVIADAYLKGIRGFDPEKALEAMVYSARLEHRGLDTYQDQGFIGADRESESVSKTLEYAYDDWCIARMAEALGRIELASEFDRRSQAWRHLLDPETGFFRPRQNQRWLEPFDPRRVDFNYTEANAWQYGFFVPHHLGPLIEALGGDEAFVARLDSLFSVDSQTTGRDQADITGLIGQYAHGNEPSHHVGWLYHYAGRPDRSVQRIGQILEEMYAAAPDGLAGNEDCGQMSSWYVLSALGLYQVAPGSNQWLLGRPLFDRAHLRLDNGKSVQIVRQGDPAEGAHVQAVRWNGKTLTHSWITHAELLGGGTLEVELGPDPSTAWGRSVEDRPQAAITGEPVLPAPYLVANADTFDDSLQVTLRCDLPSSRVYYATDPSLPEDEWMLADGPLLLRDSTRLHFFASDGDRRSPVLSSYLHRIPNEWSIAISNDANPQYTAGGPRALIDGRRGPDDWRTGMWQGYEGQDFQAVVDLGRRRPLNRAGASFLQDMRSWIWLPVELSVAVSADGEEWYEIGTAVHEVADDAEGIIRRDLVVSMASLLDLSVRYVRLHAANYGTIPGWHPGAGGEAFIFIDEIIIE